jgi:putative phosphoesterase
MRTAVVSDIHGNLTAFEAVLADLRLTSPDSILHGGDLSHGGSRPSEIIDRIRDLGWQGVLGNTDEMMFRPESLTEAALPPSFSAPIEEMASWTRESLGEERISWLRGLPRTQTSGPMALVHASPESLWRSPTQQSSDQELERVYSPLRKPIIVYGHIHIPFIRSTSLLTVVNSGSAGLPYDGDQRASYLLLDDKTPTIRRVAYDTGKETRALNDSGLPHAAWVSKMLASAQPAMP